ncbi:MAG: GNAT family N-acetyltransferase [Dehalococcoidia bacterium]|nr:GNAT family N-acetyltransferase [Dehalococcoidia bacterium]
MPAPMIRRIRAHEGVPYRDIRLRALADAPRAFGTTLAEAAARPAPWWDERAQATAQGGRAALFVAAVDERWCGLIGGELPEATATAEVISMWVEPAWRRHGVAARLLDAVAGWGMQHDATAMELWVTEGNVPAIALYEGYAFAFTSDSRAHASQQGLLERCMRRALR